MHLDPGGFAEVIRVPASLVRHAAVPIPDGLSFEQAAFVEPLACCLRGVRRSGVDLGDTVLIVGSGAIGLMLAQIARLYGARVIITDLIPQRLELARSLGVDMALHAIDDDVEAAVREATAGRGVDAAICTVPIPGVIVQTLALVRDGGSLNLFAGNPAGTLTEINLYRVYQHELSIFGTYSHATSELPEALDLIARGKVQVEPLLTHRLPLSRLAEGIELTIRNEAMKVYIEV